MNEIALSVHGLAVALQSLCENRNIPSVFIYLVSKIGVEIIVRPIVNNANVCFLVYGLLIQHFLRNVQQNLIMWWWLERRELHLSSQQQSTNSLFLKYKFQESGCFFIAISGPFVTCSIWPVSILWWCGKTKLGQ